MFPESNVPVGVLHRPERRFKQVATVDVRINRGHLLSFGSKNTKLRTINDGL